MLVIMLVGVGIPKSNTYIEISSGYSDDNKVGDKKDNKKIEFHTISSLISSKVEKIKYGQNNFGFKWNNGPDDLNKYIYNLIKEKRNDINYWYQIYTKSLVFHLELIPLSTIVERAYQSTYLI